MKNKIVKQLYITLLIFTISACTNDHLTLEKVSKTQVKFLKKEYLSSSLNYSFSLPKGWELSDSIRTDKIFCDAFKNGLSNGLGIISVEKYKSNPNNLSVEADMIKARFQKNMSNAEIIESGKSNFFDYESYYFNAIIDGKKPFQTVYFVIESPKESSYFVIGISSNKNTKIETNLATLFSCIKTFKLINQ